MTAMIELPKTVGGVIAKFNEYAAEKPSTEEWREMWPPMIFNAKVGAVGEEQVIRHLVVLGVGSKSALNKEMKEFRARQHQKQVEAGCSPAAKRDKYVTLVNLLRTDRALLPRLPRFNEMSQAVEFGADELRDVDVSRLRERLGKLGTGFSFGKDEIFDAVAQVAHEKPYHPVREYLNGLTWDGVPRLNNVAASYLGAEGSLAPILMLKWFISAVARALRPGCKVDTALILVGKQGVKKSTFFKTLAAPWFSDTAIDLGDKDSYGVMGRAWIFEWGELESMQRARSQNVVKAFMSSTEDTYRPPYGRVPVTVKRSGVPVGTTNDDDFLTDPTGNRRYWPIRVERAEIDVVRLAGDRDQLWAEAVAAFKNDEQWWLTDEEQAMLEDSQHQYEAGSPWEDQIRDYVDGKCTLFKDGEVVQVGPFNWVTTSDLLANAIGKPVPQQKRSDQMEIARAMGQLGWQTGQRMEGGARLRGYSRPEKTG